MSKLSHNNKGVQMRELHPGGQQDTPQPQTPSESHRLDAQGVREILNDGMAPPPENAGVYDAIQKAFDAVGEIFPGDFSRQAVLLYLSFYATIRELRGAFTPGAVSLLERAIDAAERGGFPSFEEEINSREEGEEP